MATPNGTADGAAADPSEIEATYPCCDIALWWHELQLPERDTTPERRAEAKEKLLQQIEKNAMAPLYRKAIEEFGWPPQEEKIKARAMEAQHEQQLLLLQQQLKDAEENYGDTEVREVLLQRAHLFCRIGDIPRAVEAYRVAYAKTVGIGSRLDLILTLLRTGIVYKDRDLVKKQLFLAKQEMEKGGDWERRNKLKVIEALDFILSRNFTEASKLLLEVLATFPSCGIISFETFVFYAALLALLCCDRQTLKEQVVFSPTIAEGADNDMKGLLDSFYNAKYREFMQYLVPVAKRVKRDLYLSPHYLFFIRSIRLKAYQQFLEPYKTVTLESLAQAFGVSVPFIEREISGFVASGRLGCRIDSVNGVVEAHRPDARSFLYLQTIKQGDVLLNRIQKLARVLSV
ncbi:26s proteasome regulatory complex subunit,putative [Eimeria tenella]|uniref:26s proteasome regulatory complex subunit,putative n=1 Tax=Eimeria tenella TaxID=5802 RepID=U6KXZ2_EIMTE|nr:26s proteasome regulatory complex subunit,putative [Eimeria tenella]CDJ40355.1 26s proteasome regulatory complex subunit,putative [Eimeria tenella]|eukprot:XP_013231105.1 26s proteasome regulatory complex subunit,putative [Eimeria tenella]